MYAPYFGLSQEPFSIAPDPRYLFMSGRHHEALAHLLYGLGGGGGFVLLTGEIGTGKTTVCRCFLEQIPGNCNVAYIFNPKLTVTELLQSVCEEFRIPLPRKDGAATVKDYLDPLNAFLLEAHANGRNSVLIIDEAQNLSEDVLEQLRLLTNLETSERKLLQILLIGQPELRAMLARPGLEQLAQRVIARYHLQALAADETSQYVRHRLEVAGLSRALPFEPRALARVHRLSGGIPRRINLLCDRALLGAYAQSAPAVTPAIVERAAREVFPSGVAAPRRPWLRQVALLGAGVAAGAAVAMALTRLDVLPATTLKAVVASAPKARASAEAPARAASAVASAAGPGPAASGALAAASAPPSAMAAAAPASAAAPAPPATLLRDEKQAWRELARAWGADAGEAADPCASLARRSLLCFSHTTSLALVRQLDRPGIVTLDRDRGTPSYAVLTAIGDRTATLSAGGTLQTVTLAALAARWSGEWSTLWRSPAGQDASALGPWVDRQLAAAGFGVQDGVPRRVRIRNFQLAQGLPPDGVLGPMTLMQLNRSAKVDEPRLRPLP